MPWLHGRHTAADADAYEPAAQPTHAPPIMRVPAGHGRHAVPLEMYPGRQVKPQLVALKPTREKLALDGRPTHGRHAVDPGAAYVPTAHGEHVPLPATRLKPGMQPRRQLVLLVPAPIHVPLPVRFVHAPHAVAPTAEYVPALQLRQAAPPAPRGRYVPAVQLVHEVERLVEKEPAGHAAHRPPAMP